MSASDQLIIDLQAAVGHDNVLYDPNELRVYACDAFPIAKGLPTVVVFPIDAQQVSSCVTIAAAAGLAIIPRGSGTGLAGAAVAYEGGVIIATCRMRQIHSIDVKNRVAVVDPGVFNLALSQAVARHPGGEDLRYSPDPSSQAASTIGGNVATNAGGINTLKHGVTTGHILGLEMVLPDGSIITTRSGELYDGIGADLPALLCGSEGTLAIVTRIWCRLVRQPRHIRTIYAVYQSTFDACKTVSDVIAEGIVPTSMEIMDGSMIKIVEDAFHYGFPATAEALLLLEIDGIEHVLDEQLGEIVAICKANNATDTQSCSDPKRRAELWSARKKAFGAIGRVSHSYCTQDACVPRSKLPEVMEYVAALGEKYDIKITNVFHAGDGNIHPILLFDEDDPVQVQRTLQISEELLKYCISIGGTPTGEHGIGIEKLHLMKVMFNPDTIDTFKRVKDTFDPDSRLNDGKLIPSDRISIELLKTVTTNSPGGAL
jgi:glycolate oxidase